MNHIYSKIMIISLISFNIMSSQAPENSPGDFENLYAMIESKAFEHELLREKKDNLTHYRNVLLGGSVYVAFELLRGTRPSQQVDFGFSHWVYPISGLCVSLFLSMVIKSIEQHALHTYEQPVINCLEHIDEQYQNKLIHLLEERNIAIPSKCIETVSIVRWLRDCQQKALIAQHSK